MPKSFPLYQRPGFWFIVAIVLAILFFFKSCNGTLGGLFGGGKADTVKVVHDTTFVLIQKDTVYQPSPKTIILTVLGQPGRERVITKTDTLEIIEVAPTDTAAILARYYQKVFYSDTLHNQYGKIVVNDSVTQNRIASRKVVTDLKIPEVTTTITLREKRNVVYIGASAIGTPASPLLAIGGDLSLKTKTDRIYGIGAYATKEGVVYYQASYRVPIRLKRR